MRALIDAIASAKKAGATPEQLNAALELQRKAQWRLDFIAAENSMGFHAPQEAAKVLGEALDYGMIAINTGFISTEVAPFGGVKESGNGREGSKYGMDDYLEIKYLCMGGIDR